MYYRVIFGLVILQIAKAYDEVENDWLSMYTIVVSYATQVIVFAKIK